MTHKFVVNTENVNEYGYRILTEGIDYVQYMRNPVVLFNHERAFSRNPEAVIGKCISLYKEGKDLIAEIEFDQEDDFAQRVEKKVKNGFINMASLFADVKESSTDIALALPGQTHETVTKCKLVELSITDIGGNDDALKLSRNGAPIQLQKIESKLNKDMSLKTIALAFALTADATEHDVLAEVNALKLSKDQADAKVIALNKQLKDIQVVDAETLVGRAVELGLLNEAFKATQLAAYEADPVAQKAILSKMIADKEAETKTDATHTVVKEVILSGKGKAPVANDQESFDYLQKHDVVKLAKIRDDEPQKYAQLAKDYANGKRYTK